MQEKLIMFSWQNFYLTGIQAGIQSGHCWMDMATFYRRTENQPECITDPREAKAAEIFWDWADNHKVVNVRNGGEQTALSDIWALFSRESNPYPHCFFREDEGLNMAITNVSIVVPEHVYAWKPEYEGGVPLHGNLGVAININNKLDDFDQALYDLIKSTKLAI